MKKMFFLILIIAISFLLIPREEEEVLVERSIDGVAAYLGYFDGEDIDVYHQEKLDNALAGKYFKDGGVSIYEFDPDSSMYEYWETQTDTCTGGFLLLYDDLEPVNAATEAEMDRELEKIQSIKFKPEAEN